MKKLLITAAILGIVDICMPAVQAREPLVFVSTGGFYPYTYSDDGKPAGIDVDIIKEMAERTGMAVKIEFMPWKRALYDVKHGKAHGAFSAFKTAEREAYAFFVRPPIHLSEYRIFVRRDNQFPFSRIEDLYGKRISKNAGFHINDSFEQAGKDKKIFIIEDVMEHSLKILSLGRIDGIAGNVNEMRKLLHEKNLSDKIVALPKPIRLPENAHLIISKNAEIPNKQALIQEISEVLKQMQDDGTYKRINASYLK